MVSNIPAYYFDMDATYVIVSQETKMLGLLTLDRQQTSHFH